MHAYIMGFKFNSTKSSANKVAASVLAGDGTKKSDALDAAGWVITYAARPGPNGPKVTIDNYGTGL